MNQTVNLAGLIVDNVPLAEAVAKVEEFIASGQPHLVTTPNPEIIVTCQDDPELKGIINNSSLRLPDGVSMVVVSKLLGTPLRERVSGIDLMLKLLETAALKGYRIYLLGGAPGIADEAAAKLKISYPSLNIVGVWDGYFRDDSSTVNQIKSARPDILFVGLGGGKQERWLNRHLVELGVPVGMVIGGSLDVISGRKKRAPQWVQALYIEWLYRLFSEPQRWKRQLALPKFLYLTLVKKVL